MSTSIIDARPGVGQRNSASRELPDCPYRGIAPFRFVDAPIFFGREEESEQLLRYLIMYRGVLFYGDSGSGKSSLINACLMPRVIDEGFLPNRIRMQPCPNAELVIERVSLQNTGRAPFLPSSFDGEVASEARIVLSCSDFKQSVLAAAESAAKKEQLKPLLIFDQFEEFVTLFEVAPIDHKARHEAQMAQLLILEMIVGLLRERLLQVKLLFVFREDYLAKIEKLIARYPDLIEQRYRLLPPRVGMLGKIIRRPMSVRRPDGLALFKHRISPSLRRRLRLELAARSDDDYVNLSEIQVACLELWRSERPELLIEGDEGEKLTLLNLLRCVRKKEFGDVLLRAPKRKPGVEGLLEHHLRGAIAQFPSSRQRDLAVAALCCMVTSVGTRNVISREDLLSRLDRDTGARTEEVHEALDHLEHKTGMVRRETRHDIVYYEIVSEFLIPWISTQKIERERVFKFVDAQKRVLLWYSVLVLIAGLIGGAFWFYHYIQNQSAIILAQQETQSAKEAATLNEDRLMATYEAAKERTRNDELAKRTRIAEEAKEAAQRDAKQLEHQQKQTESEKKIAEETALKAQRDLNAATGRFSESAIKAEALLEILGGIEPGQSVTKEKRDIFISYAQEIARLNQEDAVQTQVNAEDFRTSRAQQPQEKLANPPPSGGKWIYIGRIDPSKKRGNPWGDRIFDSVPPNSGLEFLKIGDVLSARGFVNIRSAPSIYDTNMQKWTNEPVIDLLKPLEFIKVLDVKNVEGPLGDPWKRVWARADRIPSQFASAETQASGKDCWVEMWQYKDFKGAELRVKSPAEFPDLDKTPWTTSKTGLFRVNDGITSIRTGKDAWFIGFRNRNYKNEGIRIGPNQSRNILPSNSRFFSFKLYDQKPKDWGNDR